MASTNNVKIDTSGNVTYTNSTTGATENNTVAGSTGIVNLGAGESLLTTSNGIYAIKSLISGSGISLSHDANTVTISVSNSSSSGGGSASSSTGLEGLSDVSIVNPKAGEYLSYNGTNWIATSAPTLDVDGVGIAKYSANTIRYYKMTISYSGVATTTTANTTTATTTTPSSTTKATSYSAVQLPTNWTIDLTKMLTGYMVVTTDISIGTATPICGYISVPDQANADRTVAQDYRTIYNLGAPTNNDVQTVASEGLNLLTKISDPTFVAIQGLNTINIPLTAGDSFDIYIGYLMLVDVYE